MQTTENANELFPVFLKLENLGVLIVGGGNIALEKLNAILSNSPRCKVKLVAITFNQEIIALSHQFAGIELIERVFLPVDLKDRDIVIIAINDSFESKRIRDMAKQNGKLVNVADKPDLCDFYMSSIVQKGNLKIAISTNGKSPTIAKRLKEVFNDLLPEEMDAVLHNLYRLRTKLKGDFAEKVKQLNAITKDLTS